MIKIVLCMNFRSQSFRHSSSVHSSVATNVGGSISAHPLLPLGDSSIGRLFNHFVNGIDAMHVFVLLHDYVVM